MGHHMHHPAGRSAVNRMHPANCAAGDDFFHFLIMLAIAVLMADHRFDARFLSKRHDLSGFSRAQGNRLFICNQLCAALHAELYQVITKVRHRGKAEDIRLDLFRQRGSIGADFRIPQIFCCASSLVSSNIADTGYFEARIGMKSRGMMLSRLPIPTTTTLYICSLMIQPF